MKTRRFSRHVPFYLFSSVQQPLEVLHCPVKETEAQKFAQDHPACTWTHIQIQTWAPKPASPPVMPPQVHRCHVALRGWRTRSNQSVVSAATERSRGVLPGCPGLSQCWQRRAYVLRSTSILGTAGQFVTMVCFSLWACLSAQEGWGSENSPAAGGDVRLSQTVLCSHPMSIQGSVSVPHTPGQEKSIHPNQPGLPG